MLGLFFSSRRRHTRWTGDWSSDVCSSDLASTAASRAGHARSHSYSRHWRPKGSASRRSRPTGRRSTMSTSTTRVASSLPRTSRGAQAIPARTGGDERRSPAHVVHGRPAAPEPDARADLDRAPARAADGLAAALRPALQAGHALAGRRLRNNLLHHLPRAGDRDHERLLRSDLERHGDDQRPRPRRAAALPRNARQPDLARGLPDRPLGADRGHPGAIILLVSIALGVRVHTAVLGW